MLLSSNSIILGPLASCATVAYVSARGGLRLDSKRSLQQYYETDLLRIANVENQASDLAYFQNLGDLTERFTQLKLKPVRLRVDFSNQT
jgi:hypothetical protein